MNKFAAQVPQLLKGLKLREKVEAGWAKAYDPVQVGNKPDIWLRFSPTAVAFTGLDVSSNIVRTRIMASGVTETFIDAKPPAVSPQPFPPLRVPSRIV